MGERAAHTVAGALTLTACAFAALASAGFAGLPAEPVGPAPAAVAAQDAPVVEVESWVVEFDPLPPVLGTTPEQLAQWTAWLQELHVRYGGATGRQRKRLMAQVEPLDIFDATPAYLNALRGVDLSTDAGVRGAYGLAKAWQAANYVRFGFDGDTTKMDPRTLRWRREAVHNWHRWWTEDRKAGQDAAHLAELKRKLVEKRARKLDASAPAAPRADASPATTAKDGTPTRATSPSWFAAGVVSFEPLTPVHDSTAEELATWTALLRELYVDGGGATGARRDELLVAEAALDAVAATPAYLNALIGLDMGESADVEAAAVLRERWARAVAMPSAASYGAALRAASATAAERALQVAHWRDWWLGIVSAGRDPQRLAAYRRGVQVSRVRRAEQELYGQARAELRAVWSASPDEAPRGTRIEYEPVPPAEGCTPEQLEEWTALLRERYVAGGEVSDLSRRDPLLALDPVHATPAFLNAVIGLDLADPLVVSGVDALLGDWCWLVGMPDVRFDGNRSRMDAHFQVERQEALGAWRRWWVRARGAGRDAAAAAEYRERVQAYRDGGLLPH